MQFLPIQVSLASRVRDILYTKGYVYVQGEPRTGKTPTTLCMCEMSVYQNIAIICPKGARGDLDKNKLDGWHKFLVDEELNLQKNYTLIHYEQVYKRETKIVPRKGMIREYNHIVKELALATTEEQRIALTKHKESLEVEEVSYPLRIDASQFDLVLLDEAHNIGGVGKPSLRYKTLREFCYDKPTVFMSGTSITENPLSIYYQTTICKYSKYNEYENFYKFFGRYGIPTTKKLGKVTVNVYTRYHKELIDDISTFSLFITQGMVGISEEFQANDILHYVEIDPRVKAIVDDLIKHRVILIPDNLDTYIPIKSIDMNTIDPDILYLADTPSKLRGILAHIENGLIKGKPLGNLEKIKYIMETFGDNENNVIMSHFPAERELLEMFFTKTKILSATTHAEGVDLSHTDNFIVISQDYRGAKYIQRRNRVVNLFSDKEPNVHFILSKGYLSEAIYKAVSNKKDFTDSLFNTYTKELT